MSARGSGAAMSGRALEQRAGGVAREENEGGSKDAGEGMPRTHLLEASAHRRRRTRSKKAPLETSGVSPTTIWWFLPRSERRRLGFVRKKSFLYSAHSLCINSFAT